MGTRLNHLTTVVFSLWIENRPLRVQHHRKHARARGTGSQNCWTLTKSTLEGHFAWALNRKPNAWGTLFWSSLTKHTLIYTDRCCFASYSVKFLLKTTTTTTKVVTFLDSHWPTLLSINFQSHQNVKAFLSCCVGRENISPSTITAQKPFAKCLSRILWICPVDT